MSETEKPKVEKTGVEVELVYTIEITQLIDSSLVNRGVLAGDAGVPPLPHVLEIVNDWGLKVQILRHAMRLPLTEQEYQLLSKERLRELFPKLGERDLDKLFQAYVAAEAEEGKECLLN